MVKHSQCYKPCAGCNSTPREALKAQRQLQEAVYLLSTSLPPPPFFQKLKLDYSSLDREPVPKQTVSLEGDQMPLQGHGSPQDLANSSP